MSHQSKPKSAGAAPRSVSPVKIRHATGADVQSIADLMIRTKKLNNEFDPLFAVVKEARSKAESYARDSLRDGALLVVASDGAKVVGVLRAEIRERMFYEPSREGFITDFYILPEFRRKALGHRILDQASAELKKMGAQIVVAEVPSQNEIAVRFYTKRGFRSLVQHFGRTF